ncbi:MAG: hypothetical protein FJ145_23290 [Deltaproteobacteria bacterium]|nr:hypothetical protein [Deltaproteobacteria bacterium]
MSRSFHSREEDWSTKFYSDPVTVIEFYDTMKRSVHLQPEKRLMLALLDDAVKCFQKYFAAQRGRGKRRFIEVEQWFWDKQRDDVFSFEHVCAVLGLSPGYLRRMLLKWKESTSTENAQSSTTLAIKRTRRRLHYAA